jgi:PleD family two-component response regulator
MRDQPLAASTTRADILVFLPPELLPQVRSALEGTDALTREASDLPEALRLLKSRPRLVITTPDQDGFELARTSGGYCRTTKVVMVPTEGV